jgi:WD40 repeat protein
MTFSPDGSRLATTSEDRTVKVWDARAGQELFTLRGHSRPVTQAVFDSDGKTLASASAREVRSGTRWRARNHGLSADIPSLSTPSPSARTAGNRLRWSGGGREALGSCNWPGKRASASRR